MVREKKNAAIRASNPWPCMDVKETIRTTGLDANPILYGIAKRLHAWPSPVPLCYATDDDRYHRLILTLAGYPFIDQSFRPYDRPLLSGANQALMIARELDNMAPLASRTSLRSELLWIDKMKHSEMTLPENESIHPEDWVCATLAWLLAGFLVRMDRPRLEKTFVLLLKVIFDRQAVSSISKTVLQAAKDLVLLTHTRHLDAGNINKEHPYLIKTVSDYRVAKNKGQVANRIRAVVFLLWHYRTRTNLYLDKKEGRIAVSPPEMVVLEDSCTLDVRFHYIQEWLLSSEVPGVLGNIVRNGASILLECMVSTIRTALLSDLGPGRLLIDGGGRIRFRCRTDQQNQLRRLLERTIDHMFFEDQPMGARFKSIVHLMFKTYRIPQEHTDRFRRKLAWETCPPLSIRFMEDEGGRPKWLMPPADTPILAGNLRVPTQIRIAGPGLEHLAGCEGEPTADNSPIILKARDIYRNRHVLYCCPVCKLRLEVGVVVPWKESLDAVFSQSHIPDSIVNNRGIDPVSQMAMIDLNGVGRLFKRKRVSRNTDQQAGLDRLIEQFSRRSFRFSVHWLLVVFDVMHQGIRENRYELFSLGGDDLLVATRNPEVDLYKEVLEPLHAALSDINRELPPCDALSFCAGLLKRSKPGGSVTIEHCMRLEAHAKSEWKQQYVGERSRTKQSHDTDMGIAFSSIGLPTNLTGKLEAIKTESLVATADTSAELDPVVPGETVIAQFDGERDLAEVLGKQTISVEEVKEESYRFKRIRVVDSAEKSVFYGDCRRDTLLRLAPKKKPDVIDEPYERPEGATDCESCKGHGR